jgi:lysozyme family protein
MKINPDREATVKKVANKLITNRKLYELAVSGTSVPWWFVAVIHYRESNCDFKTYLGNGEPLNRVTRLVPIGHGPFASFRDGVLDALAYQGYIKNADWSIEHCLYLLEKYNGLGYANKGLPSPYLWGGTSIQKPGKYVSDGKFDPSVTDTQLGVAPLIRLISALIGGLAPSALPTANPATGVTVGKPTALSHLLTVAIGAVLAGMGLGAQTADVIHVVSSLAGLALTALGVLTHLHVIGGTDSATVALLESILTAVKDVEPQPEPEQK